MEKQPTKTKHTYILWSKSTLSIVKLTKNCAIKSSFRVINICLSKTVLAGKLPGVK